VFQTKYFSKNRGDQALARWLASRAVTSLVTAEGLAWSDSRVAGVSQRRGVK